MARLGTRFGHWALFGLSTATFLLLNNLYTFYHIFILSFLLVYSTLLVYVSFFRYLMIICIIYVFLYIDMFLSLFFFKVYSEVSANLAP